MLTPPPHVITFKWQLHVTVRWKKILLF